VGNDREIDPASRRTADPHRIPDLGASLPVCTRDDEGSMGHQSDREQKQDDDCEHDSAARTSHRLHRAQSRSASGARRNLTERSSTVRPTESALKRAAVSG
jgi:hypothetical protein